MRSLDQAERETLQVTPKRPISAPATSSSDRSGARSRHDGKAEFTDPR